MGAFEYAALDADGRTRKGVLEGDSARQVRQALRDQGLTPLSVDEAARGERGGARRARGYRGLSATELALFTRQLATLVRSALPVEEALQAVAQQTERPRSKSLFLAVRARVVEGHALATALADFPRAFPELYRATVAAGEQSGHLDIALERLADYTENRQLLQRRVTQALIYPIILVALAVLLTGLLLVYVVPEVVRVFENIGQQLPWLTRALIALSRFLGDWGLLLLVLLLLGTFAFASMLRRPGPRAAWDAWVLRVPVAGRLARAINTARFARTFNILMASSVPVLDALRIAAEVLASAPMRRAVLEAATRVRGGASLATALRESGQFPPMLVHLVASGESSGKLEEMLDRAATHQEREVETLTGTLLTVFEPALLLAMGLMVLAIVLAILLPIFELNQLVR